MAGEGKKFQRVAVLMGGPSVEREVSLSTGAQCAEGLRAAGYEVETIDARSDLVERLREAKPDAVFNALHGRFGEDGVVQGLLEWLRLPYTHSGVAASATAMDKVRSKAVFAAAGLPIAAHALATPEAIAAAHPLPTPYVVKPVDEGSSVGVTIVTDGANRPPALETLAKPNRDGLLMAEAFVPGRELTVSVLDDRPLVVTEIVSAGWYDYHAKYSAGGSRHILPAEIPDAATEAALAYALTAHKALGCRGATRTDFRFDDKGYAAGKPLNEALIILETNTQPGMTPTSLTPEQAAHVGWSFQALVAWMIEDASLDR